MILRLNHIKVRLIGCLITACLFSAIAWLEASPADSPTQFDRTFLSEHGFTSVARGDQAELMVAFDSGFLALLINDMVWFSSPPDWETDLIASGFNKNALPSLLSIKTKDQFGGLFPANSWINVVSRRGLTIEPIPNGVRLVHRFEREGIVIPVEARLDGDQLLLTVALDEISEDPDSDQQLLDFCLAPYFGAAPFSDKGYLFVPDGSGALIDFNNRKTSYPYLQYVYGRDPSIIPAMKKTVLELIHLPVFGLSRSSGGLVAVIEEGAARAYINAETAYQKSGYNTVNAACIVRDYDVVTFREKTGTPRDIRVFEKGNFQGERFSVRYFFLKQDHSDYVAMAETYRHYLQERGRLRRETTSVEPAMLVTFIGSGLKVKPVLGIPMAVKVAYTPFDEAQAVLERLQAKGVDALLVKYEGWQRGGLFNTYPARATAEASLGGKRGFNRLVDYLTKIGAAFFPATDPVRLFKSSLTRIKELSTNRAINRAPAANLSYRLTTFEPLNQGYSHWTLRSSLVRKFYTDYLESLPGSLDFGLAPDSLGNWVSSDFAPSGGTSRPTTVAIWDELLAATAADHRLLLSRPLDYGLAYADFVSDLPFSSSRFDIQTASVPFYQILLHGFIPFSNLAANRDLSLEAYRLRLLECGAFPSYLWLTANAEATRDTALASFTNVLADDWLDEAAALWTEVAPFLRSVAGQPIVRHQILADDLRRTEFANGLAVVVNYSSETRRVAELGTIQPWGYILEAAQ